MRCASGSHIHSEGGGGKKGNRRSSQEKACVVLGRVSLPFSKTNRTLYEELYLSHDCPTVYGFLKGNLVSKLGVYYWSKWKGNFQL